MIDGGAAGSVPVIGMFSKILQRVRAVLRRLSCDLITDMILWVYPKRRRSLEAATQ